MRFSQLFFDIIEKLLEIFIDIEFYCFCYCFDDGKLMVQCDQCDCWYYGLCVGVLLEDVIIMDKFICLFCMGGMVINWFCLFFRNNEEEVVLLV